MKTYIENQYGYSIDNLGIPKDSKNSNYQKMLIEVSEGQAVIDAYEGSTRKSAEDNSLIINKQKSLRDAAVLALTVTVDGFVFDANEKSQLRLSTRLASIELDDMVKWKMHDNSSHMISGHQLKTALKLAGDETTKLWFE